MQPVGRADVRADALSPAELTLTQESIRDAPPGEGREREAPVVRRGRTRAEEAGASVPGDSIVPDADVVMDRELTVPGSPTVVWPWLVQLGKHRGGCRPGSSQLSIVPAQPGLMWSSCRSVGGR